MASEDLNKQTEDLNDSDDESGNLSGEDNPLLNEKGEARCIHVRKYQPNHNQNKKGSQKKPTILSVKCLACIRQKSDKDYAESSENQDLWLCMQCLEARCGRYSTNGHSVIHYEADQTHCLALSIHSWQIWCYTCDEFIGSELVKGKLESVVHLAKQTFKKHVRPKSQPSEVVIVKQPVGDKGHRTKSMRVVGLYNLGNTCYFNSALQNLLYLRPFREQLAHTMTRSEYKLVPKKHPELEPITFLYTHSQATEPGNLTRELNSLIKETTFQCETPIAGKKSKSKKGSISPRLVQGVIAKKHRKFSNGSQQDSHELLRFLIDMVKDEEIKRLKVAFINHFDIKDHKTKFTTYPEDKKKLLRKYASEFKNIFVFTGTFIDDIFGGKLISTVRCLSCNRVFDVEEDFLDISLPLPADSKKDKSHNKPQNKPAKKQGKKMNKAERKRLEKQNSKKTTLQDFQKTTNSQGSSENIELGTLNTSDKKRDSEMEEAQQVNKDPDNIKDVQKGEVNQEQKHTSIPTGHNIEMHEFASEMPNGGQPAEGLDEGGDGKREEFNSENGRTPSDEKRLSGELNVMSLEQSHAEDDKSNETGVLDKERSSKSDGADSLTDDGDDDTARDKGPEENKLDENQLSDDAMEVDPHPLQQASSEVEPNSASDVVVRSKEIKRLRNSPACTNGSLEHYLVRFFSPEYLEKDYLCTHCNPQLAGEQDKTSDTNTDSDGDGDEKEGSTGSIDLDTLHFSDALKQFHIKTLAPILTIHLKRFSQLGFRLQKVNRHIEYPLVLDMAPFCTADTPVRRDGEDQILYGLRGIVKHSGGMVAGHYIAYVNIADWNVPSDEIAKSNTHKGSNGDVSPTDQTMDMDNEDTNMDHREASEPRFLTPTGPYTHSKHIQPPREEWYYISDCHLSRATPEDVFSSQAYILFYERLPLVPTNL